MTTRGDAMRVKLTGPYAAKRVNRRDATLVNVRASKKRDDSLTQRLNRLEKRVELIEARFGKR